MSMLEKLTDEPVRDGKVKVSEARSPLVVELSPYTISKRQVPLLEQAVQRWLVKSPPEVHGTGL